MYVLFFKQLQHFADLLANIYSNAFFIGLRSTRKNQGGKNCSMKSFQNLICPGHYKVTMGHHLLLRSPKRSLKHSVQFISVAQSCPTLCDPMNHSTPGLPIHHQLPELTQTLIRRVGDAFQLSHPLSSPSPLAPIPPSIRVFSNESTLCIRWPKYWSFSFNISPSNKHPGPISFRMDWLDLLLSKGL